MNLAEYFGHWAEVHERTVDTFGKFTDDELDFAPYRGGWTVGENMLLPVKLINAYVNPQGYPIVPPTLAASVLYIIPPIVMFFVVQKYIMQGVVTSGLKG